MTGRVYPVKTGVFVLPKRGSSKLECEDSVGVDRRRLRFCVSDGATEGFDSRRWANMLTKDWLRGPRPITSGEQFADWLPAMGDQFDSYWREKRLPWYAEEKRRTGAFATFAGVSFSLAGGELAWSAAVLGDTCLFRRMNGAVVEVIGDLPTTGISNRPTLIPSKRLLQPGALERFSFRQGVASSGEVFLLLTDAIAAWYAGALESDRARADHFEALLAASGQRELTDLVCAERERGALRNDDVAGVRLEVSVPSAVSPTSEPRA